MSNGFDSKRNCVKSIALFVSCLLFFTVLPVSTFASVLSSSLSSSSLRPLPSSPPPSQEALLRMQQQEEEARKNAPKEMIAKRTKNSKKYVTPSGIYQTKTYPRAIHVKNDRGGWDDKEPSPSKPTSKSTTSIGFYEKYLCSSSKDTPQGYGGVATPLSLCLYAGGSSFDQMGMQSYEQMTLTHYTQGGSTWKTDTYLRFPALRDLIPEDGSITSVQLIAMDEQGSAPFSIEAKMITQAWDPTLNPLGLLPTTQSYSPPLTSTWDCSPGTPRANRTLDITPLAQDWFQGLQNNFGLCLTIPTPDVIPNGITGLDLPVLVVKYTVQGIPSDPSFGGSYYTDAITPPVLVPGRAILVDRQGDVNNAIQSFVLTQFDMSQIIPFGEDTLSVQWTFEDTFSTSQSPIPFQRPAPVSNACYHTYTFPVLNGDPLLNKDIYPNFALQATLPENDPTPPGLLPSPPYLKDSIPYIQLDTTNPRNVVDISPLVNTPVSLDKYPHYPLTQFTSVLRPDASLGQIGTSVQSPLSSLPYVNTVSAENIGEKGELEMGSSTLQFQMPTLSSGNTSLRLDLVGGNAMYQDNPFPAFSYGQKGCIYPVTRNSIVMIETNADLVTLPPTNPFDQGIIYTPIGEYLIPPPDHYTPNPPTAIVSPISDGFVYIAAAGAAISFLPVQNPTVASNTEYYNPKITNMSLQVYPENPSSKRFAIHTQTEDITRWYDASGKLTEITSSIGGSITYTYDNNNPFRLLSIESTQSGSGIDLTYDAYGRLVEMQDTQQHQYQFQYDAQNNVVRSIDALNRSFWLNYDSNGIVTSISMTSPTRSTPLSLFTIGYQSVTTSSAILPCTEGDPSGDLRVHSVMDACGNETTISYNDTNHTVTVTDASGAESTYGFYHDGTLAYIENEDGERKTFVPDSENASPAPKEEIPCEEEYGNTYTYDSLRRLVQAEDYNGEIRSWTYNAQNKPTQYVDREGNALTIAYTQDGSSIQSITSASGQVMSYQYDQNQQVVSKTYPWKNNQTLSYQYTHDANGFIDTITDPLSRVTDFNYNSMGQLLTVTDPASRVTTYSYNALGKTTNIQFGKNGVNKNVSLEYNDLGQLTSITDPKGNSTSYTYDSCGRLSSVTDALSNTTSYTYNNMGQVTTVTDAKSHTTTYTYNDKHQCISVTDPDGKTTSYAYDPHGRVSTMTDPLLHTTTFQYDDLNRLVSVTDALNNTTSYTYDKEGHLLTVTDPLDRTHSLTYDNEYRMTSVTNPLDQTTTYTYFPFGPLQSITNPLSQSVTYDYDQGGRMVSFTDIQNRTSSFVYDTLDRLTQATDSQSRSISYQYDDFNNVTQVTNPLSESTSFVYDLNGNVTSVTTPLQHTTTYTYDALDRVLTMTDPLNHTYTYTYDEVGHVSSFRDPLNHLTQWQYDVRDLLEQSTDALNQTSENTYDDARRLTAFEDPLDRVTSYTYDALHRMTQVTSPGGLTASYQYDAVSRLTQKTRPATTGQSPTSASITSFTYDDLDRLVTQTDALQSQTSFTYNTLSQLTEVSLPGSETIQYSYDTYHRLTQVQGSDNHSISYTYDALDRITQTTDSDTGSFSYVYDTLDRPTQVTGPDSKVTSFTYDHDSRVTQTTYDGNQTSFTYDAASRLTQLDAPGNRTYQNGYDNANRLLTESLPSSVHVQYAYDAINRPTSLQYILPDGGGICANTLPTFIEIGHLTEAIFRRLCIDYQLGQGKLRTLQTTFGMDSQEAWAFQVELNNRFRDHLMADITIASFTPTYNAASRITAETDTIDGYNRSYTYARDSDDQLLTAVTPEGTYTFTYDERNNRSTKRLQTPSSDTTEYYTYNEGDQLLSMTRKDTVTQTILVSYTYAYDTQGRRTSQTKTSVTPPEVTSYSYQVGGNLEQITLPDSSTIQYQYDAYGNRMQKETSTELITYHYSGASLQQEVHKDPSTLTILYTLTYVPWGFVKTIGQTSTSYYYIYDQRGNTRGITDAQGTILETYHYSPYGILLSTPSISQPHFLSGNAQCQYETESSLYYMHARYYDAHTGRFLTKDALPGSLSSPLSQNRYTYCQNDPITLIDPTGNSPENTGNPPRMSGPQSSQQVSIDTSNPCYLPDIGFEDSIQKIDISGNNDTCLANLNLHTDDGKTCYIIIILPNKAPVKVYLGTVSKGSDGSFTIGRWYSIGEIKVVGPYGPLNQETSDFIDGINEAIKFMGNNINGLLSGRDVFEAINYMNQYLNEYQWEIFSKVTSNYDVNDQRAQFMKHAIIGGYIASKMKNFSDATGTEYADEGRMNFEIGFWVSFYAERGTEWYYNRDKKHGKARYTIPLFSQNGEMGLIAIAELVKILAVAEQGGSSGDPLAFLATDVMNVSTAPGARSGDTSWWMFSGECTDDGETYLIPISFAGLDYMNNRFINVGLGVGILFNKLADKYRCTGLKPAFGEPCNLLDWLRAARHYNGEDNTIPNGITYKHAKKLISLYKILHRQNVSSVNLEYLNKFEQWNNDGAPDVVPRKK